MGKINIAEECDYCYNSGFQGLVRFVYMDRRDFLKRSIAASVLAALTLVIDESCAIPQWAEGRIEPYRTVKGLPTGKMGSVTTGRMTCGGNLFNGYARGRDSVDASDLRLHRTRLSQTGFMAGWQATSDLGSHKFLWKGAY
jgi:hypothetical protein